VTVVVRVAPHPTRQCFNTWVLGTLCDSYWAALCVCVGSFLPHPCFRQLWGVISHMNAHCHSPVSIVYLCTLSFLNLSCFAHRKRLHADVPSQLDTNYMSMRVRALIVCFSQSNQVPLGSGFPQQETHAHTHTHKQTHTCVSLSDFVFFYLVFTLSLFLFSSPVA
jgi:hypothetical protein